MTFYGWDNYSQTNSFHFGWLWFFIILIAWGLFWKGMALWKSARRDQHNWFITLLILNTMGLLEIIYLAFFQKKTVVAKSPPARRTKRQSK